MKRLQQALQKEENITPDPLESGGGLPSMLTIADSPQPVLNALG